jgi:hypothetical protein
MKDRTKNPIDTHLIIFILHGLLSADIYLPPLSAGATGLMGRLPLQTPGSGIGAGVMDLGAGVSITPAPIGSGALGNAGGRMGGGVAGIEGETGDETGGGLVARAGRVVAFISIRLLGNWGSKRSTSNESSLASKVIRSGRIFVNL